MLLVIIFTNDLLAFYLPVHASNTQRTFSESQKMKVQSWMTWQAVSSLRDFDMILSHSYKPTLEWEALGKSFRAGTQHLQQEAGVCISEANNNMIYLVSKMEAKLLILYHWEQWKKLNAEKIPSFGSPENVNLLTVWNILSSRQVRPEPGAARNIVFEFMSILCSDRKWSSCTDHVERKQRAFN